MRIGAIDCGTNSIRLLIADAVVETDENGKEGFYGGYSADLGY